MATSSTGRTAQPELRSAAPRSTGPGRTTTSSPASITHRGRRRLEVHLLDAEGRRTGSAAPTWTAPASIRTSSPTRRRQSPLRDRGRRQLRDLLGQQPRATATIGHANIDGSNPVGSFITTRAGDPSVCGLAADPNFVYWLDTGGPRRSAARHSTARPRSELHHRRGASPAASRLTRLPLLGVGRRQHGRTRAGRRAEPRTTASSQPDRRQRRSVRRRRQLAIRLLGQLRHRSRSSAGPTSTAARRILALIPAAGVTGPLPRCWPRPPRTRSPSTRSRKRRRRARRRSTPRCPAPGR